MKDHIFIAWSGSNKIALRIKNVLETKNYKCTIGGNADNSSKFASIGDTVLQQLRNCNQAIVIFQNREDGKVSNNLFFELGFALATYGQTKVHCVKKKGEDVVLPSDFDNSFLESVDCEGDDDKFVDGIIKYFFERQRMSITVNKMMLINNRYLIHDYIQSHFSEQGSKCSDYELAQYVLFYMQAGYMFGDEKKVRNELKKFKDDYHAYFSDELSIAVNMAITFFDMLLSIKPTDDGGFYIDRSVFRHFKDCYVQYRNEIREDDTGTFYEWAKVFISEQLSYAYGLYSENPELTEEKALANVVKCKEWAETSLDDFAVLEKSAPIRDNNDHKGILSLLYSYMYRNLFLCYKALGDSEKELEYLKKTKKERTSLKTLFEPGTIDSMLADNFAMEYYLTLVEYLYYADKLGLDEDEIQDYEDEIRDFVIATKRQNDRSRYVDRIEALLKKY